MDKHCSAISHREFLKVAVPFVLSTVTQPLLGAVSTAVMGQLSHAAYVGAVALGTVIFNNLYWVFGFLRVNTTSLAAQAKGAGDDLVGRAVLIQHLSMAFTIGSGLILLQRPLLSLFIQFFSTRNSEILALVQGYYSVLIWGAPFVLSNYVLLGWLMGQTHVKAALMVQVSGNLLNIVLNLWFVKGLGYHVEGIASATLIAQVATTLLGVLLIKQVVPEHGPWFQTLKDVFQRGIFRGIFHRMGNNVDLMIRTICLLVCNSAFSAFGIKFGDEIYAANAIVFQVASIMTYMIDGIANTACVFTGKSIGESNGPMLKETIRKTKFWYLVTSGFLMVVAWVGKAKIIAAFTTIPSVIAPLEELYPWCYLFPFLAGVSIVCYGILTGGSYTKPLRNASLLALLTYFILQHTLIPLWGNTGLWMALLSYETVRSIFQFTGVRRFVKTWTWHFQKGVAA